MSALTEQFCEEYHSYHGISHDRARNQRSVLASFEAAVGHDPASATPREFEDWLRGQISAGLAPTTVVKKANMVRPFFQWLWRHEHMAADDYMRLKDVPMPRMEAPEPRPYSRKELVKFWDAFDVRYPKVEAQYWGRWRRGSSKWKKVWQEAMRIQVEAVIALALDCGLRQHEIFTVSIDDIHPDNEYVVVRQGKGQREHKYREVPHSDASRLAVHRWLELRTEVMRSLPGKKHDSVWLTLDPRATKRSSPKAPMGERRFSLLICSIGDGWQYHRLRHTCGTEWVRAGVPLELVSKLLGHTTLTMTLRYAKLANGDVHTAVGKAAEKFQRAVRPERTAA